MTPRPSRTVLFLSAVSLLGLAASFHVARASLSNLILSTPGSFDPTTISGVRIGNPVAGGWSTYGICAGRVSPIGSWK